MKEFTTVEEIINDEKFISSVEQVIYKLRCDRINRPSPKKGYRYKRDWYDKMTENNQLNVAFILCEAPKHWAKKSNLSANIRNVIEYILKESIQKTLLKYEEIEKAQNSIKTSKMEK